MEDNYIGIDYGMGLVNVDKENGIRYGVISQNEVLQAWADSSEAIYPDPEACEMCNGTGTQADKNGESIDEPCEDCNGEGIIINEESEAIGFEYSADGYECSCGDDGDIFIIKSPYFTYCAYCSPCAPGAGYIMSSRPNGGIRAYCFGHVWFEDGKAPYTVYDVKTEAPIFAKEASDI